MQVVSSFSLLRLNSLEISIFDLHGQTQSFINEYAGSSPAFPSFFGESMQKTMGKRRGKRISK
jgi:hypothetical protein